MKIIFFKRLKSRILLLGILTTIIFMGGNFYITQIACKKITNQSRKKLELQSKSLGEDIYNWYKSHDLALLNLSKEIDRVYTDPIGQKILLDIMVNSYPNINFAHTINMKGWDVARSDQKQSQYYGDIDYFNKAIAGNQIISQTLITDRNKTATLCWAKAHIKSDQIILVTSICSHLKTLKEKFNKLQLGKTGYVVVVDKNADTIVDSDDRMFLKENSNNLSQYPPIKNILQGNQGFLTFTDHDQIRWNSYTVSLNNGWILVIQQKEAELLDKKIQLQNFLFLLTIIVTIGINGLTLLGVNCLVIRINHLADMTNPYSTFEENIIIKLPYHLIVLPNSSSTVKNLLKNSVK